jgi:hypothetical protein
MHSIRLRHPWEEISSVGELPKYRRRFNRPTSLDEWERVTLEIDRITHPGSVSLNGAPLGRFDPNSFFTADVTAMLQPANELVVGLASGEPLADPPVSHSIYIVEPDAPLGSPFGDVRLTIQTVRPEQS